MRRLLPVLFLPLACTSTASVVLDAAPLPDASADAGEPIDARASDAETLDAGTCDPPAAAEEGTVKTDVATLRGVTRGATWAFLGVRYAAPPVGALRFAPPAPPACETAIREANVFGPICPQLDRQGQPAGDEDCLSLNVWTPKASTAPMPVLFFIHGGGNNQGSSSVALGTRYVYDGEELASRGNVVVTINYRLGALGFLAHADLDGESSDHTSGNWGLRDQLAALAWVQRNIAAFGGDPAHVMIFGESAGGLNVCALYTSPLARGLFATALVESGGCAAATKARALESAGRLLQNTGCADIACLRTKTPAEILAALPIDVTGLAATDFGPLVDGTVLPVGPLDAFTSGAHADRPLVMGSNADETYDMLPPPAQVPDRAAFEAAARTFLLGAGAPADKLDQIIAIYPLSDYEGSAHAALVALTTDWRWTCATRLQLYALGSTATAPRYRYYFTHHLDPARAPVRAKAGAYHSLELFYVFGSVNGAGGYMPTQDDLELSARMQRYWTRFAATGDPNDPSASGDPRWPVYDDSDPYLGLDAPTTAGTGVRSAQCTALAALLR